MAYAGFRAWSDPFNPVDMDIRGYMYGGRYVPSEEESRRLRKALEETIWEQEQKNAEAGREPRLRLSRKPTIREIMPLMQCVTGSEEINKRVQAQLKRAPKKKKRGYVDWRSELEDSSDV